MGFFSGFVSLKFKHNLNKEFTVIRYLLCVSYRIEDWETLPGLMNFCCDMWMVGPEFDGRAKIEHLWDVEEREIRIMIRMDQNL